MCFSSTYFLSTRRLALCRFEKRHKNISAHLSPCFRDVTAGDIVTIGECRPLAKTVTFNVIKVSKGAGKSSKKGFAKF